MLFVLILEIASNISIFEQTLCELEYRSVSLQYSNAGEDLKNVQIFFMNRSAGKSILAKGYLNGAASLSGSDLWKSFLPKQL